MKNTFYLNLSCTGSRTELTSGCAGAESSSAGVLTSSLSPFFFHQFNFQKLQSLLSFLLAFPLYLFCCQLLVSPLQLAKHVQIPSHETDLFPCTTLNSFFPLSVSLVSLTHLSFSSCVICSRSAHIHWCQSSPWEAPNCSTQPLFTNVEDLASQRRIMALESH